MKFKQLAAATVVAGLALTGVLVTTAPANAEPVAGGLSLVGSDTLQDVANALTNGTSVGGSFVRLSANNATLGSFDAFGSSAIQTKPGGPFFGRPAGSGDGVTALSRSIDGANYSKNNISRAIAGQVDFARSSSGATVVDSGPLLYVPFGRDAVSYAYRGASDVTVPAEMATLSADQLKQIYSGDIKSVGGVTVVPIIPQDGSGTRNFFLNALYGTSGTPAAPAGAAGNPRVQENDASQLTPAAGTIWIAPFSAASWIAQSNGVTGVNTIANTSTQIGAIDGKAVVSGSGSSLSANSTGYNDTRFGRDTYIVAEYARTQTSSSKYDAGVAQMLDSSELKSLANFGGSPASAGPVKRKFGFLPPLNSTPFRAASK